MARDAVDDDLRDLDEATVEAIRDAVDHQERRELQRLAKLRGIKANQKTQVLVEELGRRLAAYDAGARSATPPPPTPTPVPATVASASPSAPVVNPSTSATGRSRASHVPRPRAVGRNNNPGKQPVSPVGDPRKEPPAKPSNCYFIDENGRTAIDPRCL